MEGLDLCRKAQDGLLDGKKKLLLSIASKPSVFQRIEFKLATNSEWGSGQKLGLAHFH
jgi:hypothetical protein